MSLVSDVVRVRILMADYAAVDAAGKLSVIGGGISVVLKNPNAGQTAPVTLVVSLAVPPDRYGDECAIEITLEDASGEIVTMPGAVPGAPQPLQINNSTKFSEPMTQRPEVAPKGYLWAVAQLVAQFPVGLPLASGAGYQWRVKIDNQTNDEWTERFIVAE